MRHRDIHQDGESLVGAGIVQVACAVGESYGLSRATLLRQAGLNARDLDDPGARLPAKALFSLVEHIVQQTQDRSFGLRFGEAMDLRTQGFWGYLFLSCLSVRQAIGLLLRFSRLRHSARVSFREEDGWAIIDWANDPRLPRHLDAVAGDAFLACFCHNRRRWVAGARGDLHAYLAYPEEPHHAALRALVSGSVSFDMPFNRVCIPAAELGATSRRSDRHLLRLSIQQLEHQLAQSEAFEQRLDLSTRVRRRLRTRLHEGASLEDMASGLRRSTRTLRRKLQELGVSYSQLLEQVRHELAIDRLTHGHEAIAEIAERLGYGDPANFRRAFRRWTGLSPGQFRERQAQTGVISTSEAGRRLRA